MSLKISSCVALVCVGFILSTVALAFNRPEVPPVPACPDPTIHNVTLYYDMLEDSPQMPPQEVALHIGIPLSVLVPLFNQPLFWPVWNHLFGAVFVDNPNLPLCGPFDKVNYTNAPHVNFPAGMTAPHYIDQHGYNADQTAFAFGWVFKLIADDETIAFGRHTFELFDITDPSGVSATLVHSFEKVAGPQLSTSDNAYAWTVAIQESLLDGINGFVCLERVYKKTGSLNPADVKATCMNFTP